MADLRGSGFSRHEPAAICFGRRPYESIFLIAESNE